MHYTRKNLDMLLSLIPDILMLLLLSLYSMMTSVPVQDGNSGSIVRTSRMLDTTIVSGGRDLRMESLRPVPYAEGQ